MGAFLDHLRHMGCQEVRFIDANEMGGQMKAFLDRTNRRSTADCRFRDVYLLVAAEATAPETPRACHRRASRMAQGAQWGPAGEKRVKPLTR